MDLRALLVAALLLPLAALASNDVRGPAVADGNLLVGYAASLRSGESHVEIINDHVDGAPLDGPAYGSAVTDICIGFSSPRPAPRQREAPRQRSIRRRPERGASA